MFQGQSTSGRILVKIFTNLFILVNVKNVYLCSKMSMVSILSVGSLAIYFFDATTS
jgi:hypothetical protein